MSGKDRKISVFEFLSTIRTEEEAIEFLERQRWGDIHVVRAVAPRTSCELRLQHRSPSNAGHAGNIIASALIR